MATDRPWGGWSVAEEPQRQNSPPWREPGMDSPTFGGTSLEGAEGDLIQFGGPVDPDFGGTVAPSHVDNSPPVSPPQLWRGFKLGGGRGVLNFEKGTQGDRFMTGLRRGANQYERTIPGIFQQANLSGNTLDLVAAAIKSLTGRGLQDNDPRAFAGNKSYRDAAGRGAEGFITNDQLQVFSDAIMPQLLGEIESQPDPFEDLDPKLAAVYRALAIDNPQGESSIEAVKGQGSMTPGKVAMIGFNNSLETLSRELGYDASDALTSAMWPDLTNTQILQAGGVQGLVSNTIIGLSYEYGNQHDAAAALGTEFQRAADELARNQVQTTDPGGGGLTAEEVERIINDLLDNVGDPNAALAALQGLNETYQVGTGEASVGY